MPPSFSTDTITLGLYALSYSIAVKFKQLFHAKLKAFVQSSSITYKYNKLRLPWVLPKINDWWHSSI